ncbi:MAG: putative glycoside hydrolase [Oscillospiraceae bacterium]|jgi:hypothetical protein|nr:putative glycoside hydrolase [Oscillospiraceae bacterium]
MANRGIPKPPRAKPVRRKRRGSRSGSFGDDGIGGNKRVQWLRTALRWSIRCVGFLAVVLVGFFAADTLFRISELPPAEEPSVTAAPVTESPSAAPPPKEVPDLRAIFAERKLLDTKERTGRIPAQAQQAGANAVLFRCKDEEGYLTYRSLLPQQQILFASRKARSRAEGGIADLLAADIRPVAYVQCFRDPIAAAGLQGGAVLRKGTALPWKDSAGAAWLNPYSEAAREYLLGVIRELTAMGIQDIVLDAVCFPSGNLSGATFPGESLPANAAPEAIRESRNQVLLRFLREAKQAAPGARIYCVMPAQTALNGSDDYGGDLWNAAVDCVIVDTRGAPWVADADWGPGRSCLQLLDDKTPVAGRTAYLVLGTDTD